MKSVFFLLAILISSPAHALPDAMGTESIKERFFRTLNLDEWFPGNIQLRFEDRKEPLVFRKFTPTDKIVDLQNGIGANGDHWKCTLQWQDESKFNELIVSANAELYLSDIEVNGEDKEKGTAAFVRARFEIFKEVAIPGERSTYRHRTNSKIDVACSPQTKKSAPKSAIVNDVVDFLQQEFYGGVVRTRNVRHILRMNYSPEAIQTPASAGQASGI